jgi:hypothetical protein
MLSSLMPPHVPAAAGSVLLPSLRLPLRHLLLLPSLWLLLPSMRLLPLPLSLMTSLRCLSRSDPSRPQPRLPDGFIADATRMTERQRTSEFRRSALLQLSRLAAPPGLRGLPRSREECVRGLSKLNSSSVILGAGEAGATAVAPLFELGATDVLLVARP